MALLCSLRAAHHKTRLQQRAQCTSTENNSSTEAHARRVARPGAMHVRKLLNTITAQRPTRGTCSRRGALALNPEGAVMRRGRMLANTKGSSSIGPALRPPVMHDARMWISTHLLPRFRCHLLYQNTDSNEIWGRCRQQRGSTQRSAHLEVAGCEAEGVRAAQHHARGLEDLRRRRPGGVHPLLRQPRQLRHPAHYVRAIRVL